MRLQDLWPCLRPRNAFLFEPKRVTPLLLLQTMIDLEFLGFEIRERTRAVLLPFFNTKVPMLQQNANIHHQ